MKLSEMILDEKIRGTLDQGRNCLIIFEEEEPTEMFKHAISTFNNLAIAMLKIEEAKNIFLNPSLPIILLNAHTQGISIIQR